LKEIEAMLNNLKENESLREKRKRVNLFGYPTIINSRNISKYLAKNG
jgi:hypothetical protein